jgi:hypothetical protein
LSQAALWKGLERALRNLRESLISRQVKHLLRLEIERPERAAHDSGVGQWQAKARVKTT